MILEDEVFVSLKASFNYCFIIIRSTIYKYCVKLCCPIASPTISTIHTLVTEYNVNLKERCSIIHDKTAYLSELSELLVFENFCIFLQNKEWHIFKLCWFMISQIELQNYVQNKIYFYTNQN